MRLWGALMSDHLPVPVRIRRIVQETPSVRTLYFDKSFPSVPGQFVMVWIPGIDEIPMALSSPESITVQEVGDATRALCNFQIGDLFGIRGPFGNGFTAYGRVMAIAGGVGAAPLLPLARQVSDMTFLLGARTEADLLFHKELALCSHLSISTDDGSAGFHGNIGGLLHLINPEEFDTICVCGPELMMKSVMNVLCQKGIENRGQFSLHRYMKCGVGLCGSCCIDPEGFCVCRDGPVFSGDIIKNSELGHYHRDASGRKE